MPPTEPKEQETGDSIPPQTHPPQATHFLTGCGVFFMR